MGKTDFKSGIKYFNQYEKQGPKERERKKVKGIQERRKEKTRKRMKSLRRERKGR